MGASSTFNAADGDGYELQMGRWSRRLAEPFLDFVGTENGERVLDVGCGTGSLAFGLIQRCAVKELCGIDFSAAYVDHDGRAGYKTVATSRLDRRRPSSLGLLVSLPGDARYPAPPGASTW